MNESKPIFTVEIFITHKDEVLLQKRSMTMKKFPGWWTIPGGHIDAGEDPLSACIRETKEETGMDVFPQDMKLRYVSMHNHLDRGEMYVAFAFATEIKEKTTPIADCEEGNSVWIKKSEALQMNDVFPPIKYYFEHVLNDNPGIIYNMSDWENTTLVKIHSQSLDNNS